MGRGGREDSAGAGARSHSEPGSSSGGRWVSAAEGRRGARGPSRGAGGAGFSPWCCGVGLGRVRGVRVGLEKRRRSEAGMARGRAGMADPASGSGRDTEVMRGVVWGRGWCVSPSCGVGIGWGSSPHRHLPRSQCGGCAGRVNTELPERCWRHWAALGWGRGGIVGVGSVSRRGTVLKGEGYFSFPPSPHKPRLLHPAVTSPPMPPTRTISRAVCLAV